MILVGGLFAQTYAPIDIGAAMMLAEMTQKMPCTTMSDPLTKIHDYLAAEKCHVFRVCAFDSEPIPMAFQGGEVVVFFINFRTIFR